MKSLRIVFIGASAVNAGMWACTMSSYYVPGTAANPALGSGLFAGLAVFGALYAITMDVGK